MDGKRFGIGLAAGLLIGLAVVASAGGLGSTPVSSAVHDALRGNFGPSAAATTTTTLVTSTVAGSTSTNTAGVPVYSGNSSQSGSSGGTKAITSSTTAQGSTTGNPNTNPSTASNGANQADLNALVAGLTPKFSSNVASIPQQAPLANVFVFVPVALAFVLGAVLYLSSRRNREEPDDEDERSG